MSLLLCKLPWIGMALYKSQHFWYGEQQVFCAFKFKGILYPQHNITPTPTANEE